MARELLCSPVTDGSKDYFLPSNSGPTIEGRIFVIKDPLGNRVTCTYTNGVLASVTDPNGAVTNIQDTTDDNAEHVSMVTLPDGRSAQFAYDANGNLTTITDMLGDSSTLSYGAMAWSGQWSGNINQVSTSLEQDVTGDDNLPLVPADDGTGTLLVGSTNNFPNVGTIQVGDGGEVMTYSGVDSADNELTGIKRGSPAWDDDPPDTVYLIQSEAKLTADITVNDPQCGGTISVDSTNGFPTQGWLMDDSGEIIGYTGTTQTTFTGVIRLWPTYECSQTYYVYLIDDLVMTPYLQSIETPAKKTMFTYQWWMLYGEPYPHMDQQDGIPPSGVAALHEVYECGPTETYASTPTIHYAWCGVGAPNYLNVTRYPTSVNSNSSGCDDNNSTPPHWTGGLTFKHVTPSEPIDAIGSIIDELGNTTVTYGYNFNRDLNSVTRYTDAVTPGNQTIYNFADETTNNYADRDMTKMTDPLGNQWNYTYTNHDIQTEEDPYRPVHQAVSVQYRWSSH